MKFKTNPEHDHLLLDNLRLSLEMLEDMTYENKATLAWLTIFIRGMYTPLARGAKEYRPDDTLAQANADGRIYPTPGLSGYENTISIYETDTVANALDDGRIHKVDRDGNIRASVNINEIDGNKK